VKFARVSLDCAFRKTVEGGPYLFSLQLDEKQISMCSYGDETW